MNELETAKLACMRAGVVAMKYFRSGLSADRKEDDTLVTMADIECEQTIKNVILKDHPAHSFLGEEGGKHGETDEVWIIDPIDGTTNFFHGVEQFAISIAFMKAGKLLCGCVYIPTLKKLYSAQSGRGAFLGKQRIRVSRVDRLKDSLLVSGFPYDDPALERTFKSMKNLRNACHDIRRFGAAAFDMCLVAEGVCEGFFEYDLRAWDVAAAMLIVREAGGIVSDINGKDADVNSVHFLATNGLVHKELLGKLERV